MLQNIESVTNIIISFGVLSLTHEIEKRSGGDVKWLAVIAQKNKSIYLLNPLIEY